MRVFEFDGGRVEVGIGGRFEPVSTVRCNAPRPLMLTPNEARTFALALMENAADVEKRNIKKGAS